MIDCIEHMIEATKEEFYMNEFENKLIIKDEAYQSGFFPRIPSFGKRGSAFILTGGCNDDIIVNERTTTKQIRQGRYTRLVEISTLPYTKEIRFNSSSKETAYSFDVYIKAVIQVNDPILFYENKNIDVDAYFDNLFSLDVRRITRLYSILDYDGMDTELTEKLSSYNNIDASTGFSYRISVVAASPGEKAQDYVHKYSTQQLDIGLKNNARKLAASLAKTFEDAIMTEVVEGKLSEAEAILKIQEYKNANFDGQIKRIEELREKGFITDKEAKSYVMPVLGGVGTKEQSNLIERGSDQNNLEDTSSVMDDFYTEE